MNEANQINQANPIDDANKHTQTSKQASNHLSEQTNNQNKQMDSHQRSADAQQSTQPAKKQATQPATAPITMVKSSLIYALRFAKTSITTGGLLSLLNPKKAKAKSVYMDIDLACVLYDKALQPVEVVWFKNLRDTSESIRHHGDEYIGVDKLSKSSVAIVDASNLERMELRLKRLPTDIHGIALLVTCLQGQPLNTIKAGELELQDNQETKLIQLDLTKLTSDCHTLWLAQLSRSSERGGWQLHKKLQPINIKPKKHTLKGYGKLEDKASNKARDKEMDKAMDKMPEKTTEKMVDKTSQINTNITSQQPLPQSPLPQSQWLPSLSLIPMAEYIARDLAKNEQIKSST